MMNAEGYNHIMKVAPLGDAVPQRGGFLSKLIGRSVLAVLGWHMEGEFPNKPKFVIIVAPHTSNWDFFVGMAGRLTLGLYANWLGKHTIFIWPLGVLLRRLGGIPLNRSASHRTVKQVVELFREKQKLVLGLSPEGTRKKVEKWKTGFYHIALQSGVPIVPVYLDYAHKILGIGPAMTPTGDSQKDLSDIGAFFSNIQGKHPELFSTLRP
jgi:1-acyl-sn-glycerol-3-phosphate acyltransferase